MIKKLLILFLFLGFSFGQVNLDTLNLRNETYYPINSDKGYSGSVFTLNDNGEKGSEGTLKNGKPNGLWKEYYINGQIIMVGNFKNGKKDGSWKEYYGKNGQLKEKGTYNNGEWDGPFKSYYENGQLEKEETYKDGKLIKSKE